MELIRQQAIDSANRVETQAVVVHQVADSHISGSHISESLDLESRTLPMSLTNSFS